ncbi:MAG: hypothetical protein KatS3mg110_0542 [Pirellulaceae bacterium]|nr:MAG: hypothetical protein KatS3mg110_0542 [Pirellulaceae bacterium]
MRRTHYAPLRWMTLIGILVTGFVLGHLLPAGLAWQAGRPPFRDAGEQREQIIRELQEIKGLLRAQNELLRQQLAQGNKP